MNNYKESSIAVLLIDCSIIDAISFTLLYFSIETYFYLTQHYLYTSEVQILMVFDCEYIFQIS